MDSDDYMENVDILPKNSKANKGGGKAAKAPKKAAARKPLAPANSIDDYAPSSESGTVSKKAGGKSIEEIYQKKTQLEHILLRPDTYVGTIEKLTSQMWVVDPITKELVNKDVSYVPGLYKIFDEIIVNAADNKQRDPTMNLLKVNISPEEGTISVWNNGKGIPIVMHKEHGVYIPELIFGHLLTGSNFNDNEKKTTGGRNGYGAKLANIFSTEFIVETQDSAVGKHYRQVFKNNMGSKGSPTIKDTKKGSDYTCITFKPDFERFKMDGLDQDIISLFYKRVYDIAGVSDRSLKVYLNDERVEISSFSDYVDMYLRACGNAAVPKVFEKVNDRWEVAISASDGSAQQVSFVNSICTMKGGQHVQVVADQVAAKLVQSLKKKNKGVELKPAHIKNHLFVFVNALIENPGFDSQTKETLTTRPSAFGSTCALSDKFLKQVEKNVGEHILSWAKFKQTAELKKKSGTKKAKLTGIAKLDDANFAGTAKGKNCTLILTEGDSAKALAVSGLGIVGRDYFGVFPLKGKLLNVREASHAQIMKNEEIQNLVRILGLKFGTNYADTSSLRYGHLMIMTDQDHDGSHIKGLVINFIHHFWPSLLQVPDFLQEFITPIVKVSKGSRTKSFFTIPEYEHWKEETNGAKGWKIKYYKGLGTSTSEEAKEYFSDLSTHLIPFQYESDGDDNAIDMAFSKKRVEERKDWLNKYEQGTHVDYNVDRMVYSEFINKELILFSMADNIRSIPSLVDGFKPSQRKVLFCCFKRKLKNEVRISQLAGYVSEHSAYHHGEASLHSTIVNMAQNYVGSNNINLLVPSGQFGTRLMGGKDAASARYIFTKLENITRHIFHADDDPVLNYLDEDGQRIEPVWYVPIIPLALVNGSDGIGTGWSSSVPNYNPRDLIENIRLRLQGEDMNELTPWYRGFTGLIEPKEGAKERGNFTAHGRFEWLDESTIHISELPLRTWTSSYKQFLETLMNGGEKEAKILVKDFKENHTETTVSFTVTFTPEGLAHVQSSPGGVMKVMKLEGSISTSNMHMFNPEGHIKKYNSPLQVIDDFLSIRLSYYEKRKENLVQKLEEEWTKLKNKVRFILAVIKGEMVVSNRKKADILAELAKRGYDRFLPKASASSHNEEENGPEESDMDEDEATRGYDYLLSMKLWSLTMEKVQGLKADLQTAENDLEALRAKTLEQMYLEDLDALEEALGDYESAIERQNSGASKRKGKAGGKTKAKKGKDEDEDEDGDSDYEVPKPKKTTKPRTTVPKASQKPSTAKTAPSAKSLKPQSSRSGGKTASPSPPTEAMDIVEKAPKKEQDEEETLSLAQRMAMRLAISQSSPPPSPDAESNDDGDDIFEVPEEKEIKPKKASVGSKKGGSSAAAKRNRSPAKPPAARMNVAPFDFVSPEKKKTRTLKKPTTSNAAASKPNGKSVTSARATSKPPLKPKAPEGGKKGGAKKKKVIDDSDEDDSAVEDVIETTVQKTPKPTRARRAPVSYAVDSEDSDEDFEVDEDSEFEE